MKKLMPYLVPAFSIVIIFMAFIFIKPTTTGLVVLEQDENVNVDADITLSTKEGEVIPSDAIVEVWVDDRKGEMSISQFIMRTKQEFRIEPGKIEEFDFYGNGFTGDYTYRLSLSQFGMNQNLESGSHTFIVRIVYRGKVLYEKESSVII